MDLDDSKNDAAIFEYDVIITDNSGFYNNKSLSHPGFEFPYGETTVQVNATDRDGNLGQCHFRVIVKGKLCACVLIVCKFVGYAFCNYCNSLSGCNSINKYAFV